VSLYIHGEEHRFDKVFIATHSDTALAMLEKPTDLERRVLGGIEYQDNTMCLHTDTSILPKNKKAWASWNARIDNTSNHKCTVSYYMNLLQNIESEHNFIVSLNCDEQLDKQKILVKRHYAHPVYNENTMRSQHLWNEIAGDHHTYYCGAYWGWGFHEDGISSALRAVQHFDKDMISLSGVLNPVWKNVA